MADETPTINLVTLGAHFSDEGKAYELIESIRWPNGPVCPHCGVIDDAVYLEPKGEGRHTRQGKVSKRRVWKCRSCRKQFSVLVGTIFQGSHIPLPKWLLAIHAMSSNKNGVAAFELHRTLKVSYKTAWFMCHRIREAMKREPLAGMLSGTVEADETYIGGKQSNKHQQGRTQTGKRPVVGEWEEKSVPQTNWQDTKTPVFTLVDRESGEVRSQVMPRVTSATVGDAIRSNVNTRLGVLMTDQAPHFAKIGREMPSHHTVNHAQGEYVRGHAYTNTAEGYFSQLKRSIDGTFHHVGVGHLQRYLVEFDYRYSTRKVSDDERTRRLIRQTTGKRLTYRKPLGRD